MWFDQLTGFAENPTDVARYLQLDGTTLYSHANGRTFACGHFAAVSLASLQQQMSQQQLSRQQVSQPHSASQNNPNSKRLTLREWVGDVQRLHADSRSAGALFQVASQFNALEMPSPDISPDHGISDYQYDRTQGPACAIACGAGTLYRQYFLPFGQSPAAGDTTYAAADPVSAGTLTSSHFPSSHWPTSQATAPLAANTLRGQTRHRQLDMAAPLHQALQQALGCGPLWRMQNGYLLADEPALRAINHYLQHASEPCKTELRNLLQIGMQWHTEVTLKPQAAPGFMKGEFAHAVQNSVQYSDQNSDQHSAPAQTKTQTQAGHLVSQAYCSALPVAYNDQSADLWQPFAQLVLDAAYEATLAAAVINAQQTGNNTVFLTQLGGGAFGNRSDWIFTAIERALRLYQHFDLDVVMVSYGRASGEVARLMERLG